MIFAINVDEDSNLLDVVEELKTLGDVHNPNSTERYLHVTPNATSPSNLHERLHLVTGVSGCCDADYKVTLNFVKFETLDQVAADDWALPYISGDNTLLNYEYDADGSGASIYLVDTLANPDLQEFGGRLSIIFNPTGIPLSVDHGTCTASWAGGSVHGVAKGVTLYNSAGFSGDGTGTVTTIANALSAVADHIEASNPTLPPIINCSFTASAAFLADPFSAMIDRLVALGAIIVASSGNDNINFDSFNLTNVWPAMNAKVFTAGAHDKTSARATFSNHGSEVDIHAPGVDCASVNRDGIIVIASGTSLSAPFVAGCLACAIQAGIVDPVQWIKDLAVIGTLTGRVSGPDGVAFKPHVLLGGVEPAPPSQEPITAASVLVIDGGNPFSTDCLYVLDGGDPDTPQSPFNVIDEEMI
jgi:hypothetical protein